MDLKILHNKHSNYFFLLTIFLCLLQFFIKIDTDQAWVYITCFFLIITVGVSHGGLDNLKGKKLFNKLKLKSSFLLFYLAYISIAISVIIIWILEPSISLLLFLIIASYHFGKEDTQFLINKHSILNICLYFFKGLLIVLAPLFFHFNETVNIFKFLLIENETFYSMLTFIETNQILTIGIILSTLSSIFLFLNEFEVKKFIIFLDYFSILILNYYLSPLVAFTIYFCFLHSFRHSISLIFEIDNLNFNNGLMVFIKTALPLTILTAILCLISIIFLKNSYELDSSILKVIFIGLASLTFPHILLEYLLEKNEKQRN